MYWYGFQTNQPSNTVALCLNGCKSARRKVVAHERSGIRVILIGQSLTKQVAIRSGLDQTHGRFGCRAQGRGWTRSGLLLLWKAQVVVVTFQRGIIVIILHTSSGRQVRIAHGHGIIFVVVMKGGQGQGTQLRRHKIGLLRIRQGHGGRQGWIRCSVGSQQSRPALVTAVKVGRLERIHIRHRRRRRYTGGVNKALAIVGIVAVRMLGILVGMKVARRSRIGSFRSGRSKVIQQGSIRDGRPDGGTAERSLGSKTAERGRLAVHGGNLRRSERTTSGLGVLLGRRRNCLWFILRRCLWLLRRRGLWFFLRWIECRCWWILVIRILFRSHHGGLFLGSSGVCFGQPRGAFFAPC